MNILSSFSIHPIKQKEIADTEIRENIRFLRLAIRVSSVINASSVINIVIRRQRNRFIKDDAENIDSITIMQDIWRDKVHSRQSILNTLYNKIMIL
uniref:Uncharacterized protein n=1 Tax=Onchocerca volvulus TaxID=6282 RepID=A0A8R1TS90_ONCVO